MLSPAHSILYKYKASPVLKVISLQSNLNTIQNKKAKVLSIKLCILLVLVTEGIWGLKLV